MPCAYEVARYHDEHARQDIRQQVLERVVEAGRGVEDVLQAPEADNVQDGQEAGEVRGTTRPLPGAVLFWASVIALLIGGPVCGRRSSCGPGSTVVFQNPA